VKSFDNKYIASDTVVNHVDGILGHLVPHGLVLSILNDLKNKGGSMRVLIPSHLGFGVDGSGSGSSTIANGHIAGNQCLDYTINLIDDQAKYDDQVINNYIQANNLSGYTKTASGLYYKITTPPTGANTITINSAITCNYTGQLMNNTFFDNSHAVGSNSPATFSDITNTLQAKGVLEGFFLLGKGGGSISLIMPSALGYGAGGLSGSIPNNACLRFEITVTNVAN
jgi:FKBP-type peptidyl-prolyl cis-trans isomerase